MTQNKRFTVIRKRNQVSKEMGNYIQDRGTTILKLSFLEDCKDVCDILNKLNDEKEIALDGIKIADDLIKKYGDEDLKHRWEKEVVYMTEKRFEVFKTDRMIGINDNGESIGNIYDVCDLLNGFAGTIKDLSDDYQRLMIENRELKRQLRGALNG